MKNTAYGRPLAGMGETMKKYDSLRDYVRNYISSGINDGTFTLGDRISEQSVADRLGVSRTPAREALMQLHTEGLLEYTPRKGFSIKKISEKERSDIHQTIAALDAYAALCAMPKLTEEHLAALRECIEKIDIAIKYRNSTDYRLLQHQFHHLYRSICNNDTILQYLESLEYGLVPQVFLGEDEDKLFQLYAALNDEHRRVVELFEARDSEALYRFLSEVHWSPEREEFSR